MNEICEASITIGNTLWSCTCNAGHTGPHFSQAPITHILIDGPDWTDEQAEMMTKVNEIVKFAMDANSARRNERILEFLYEEFQMSDKLKQLRGILTVSKLEEEYMNRKIIEMMTDSDKTIADLDIPF
jgi:hypothetical protein